MIRIGVLTVSDRASKGEYEDRGGPAILSYLQDVLVDEWEAEARIVPDEADQISAALVEMADALGCSWIITTGGTGPAPRDVTPEATEAVCQKMMPGFGEQMRAVSVRTVPTAILSRQTAGIRGKTLILNLPGNPKAIRECLDVVIVAVPYCLELIGAPFVRIDGSRLGESK